ncbi:MULTISPECIES: hypothetical protein [unclassified Achromobacter]|uniref:hypothetical protein n=1 Tax=unclassified Achromobacter TaxID=2626865 RepID=UPI000B51E2B3|nr:MULTISPECIES: hypothetical protein [unclassified Achromobacter]OWT79931.1 hypothetical protein CEY05_00425 [Achromobacter sp. HZ34]OWT81815.1 hypothetical protein CEY04_00425 [Achromobacter sp. HZ28]
MTDDPTQSPLPFAPLSTRALWRLRATLFLIWLLGGFAVALGFAVNNRLFGGKPLSKVAGDLALELGDGSVTLLAILSLAGLTGIAFVCYRAWRRRADLGEYWYLGALSLGVYGYFVAWTAGGLAAGVVMAITDGWDGIMNVPKAVVLAWLFGATGVMFNVLNLLLVVPQVIWCWQRTVHRARLRARAAPLPQRLQSPTTEPPDLPSPLPRRSVLAAWAIGVIGLAILDHQYAKNHWPYADLVVDLGEDATSWVEERGPENFDSYLSTSARASRSWVWSNRGPIPDETKAIFEHGALRVQWTGIHSFDLYNLSENASDHRIRAVEWVFQTIHDYSHEQGLAFVQATLAQFAKGAWQAETLPADKDSIAPPPGQIPSLATWVPLVNQRKPLHWSWQAGDVRAKLRVENAWGTKPGDPPTYTVILRFEERTKP